MNALLHVICLLLSSVCSVLCQSCAPEEVEKCTQRLRSIYNSNDGPVIVKNEAQLTELCTHQQLALSCINNFVDQCMSEPHKNVFNNLTSGVQDFISDFCSADSNTRKVYIKHLDCFNKQVSQVHSCSQSLHEWNKNTEKSPAPKEETMRQACCRYDQAMLCIRTVVRNGCPREAADLFDGMVSKVTKQFFQIANCDQHKYELAECSGALSTLTPSLYSIFFGSAILVLSNMFRKFC